MKRKFWFIVFAMIFSCFISFGCDNSAAPNAGNTPDAPSPQFEGKFFYGYLDDECFGTISFHTDNTCLLSIDVAGVIVSCTYTEKDGIATITGTKDDEVDYSSISLQTSKIQDDVFTILFPAEICQIFDPSATEDFVVDFNTTEPIIEEEPLSLLQEGDKVRLDLTLPEGVSYVQVYRKEVGNDSSGTYELSCSMPCTETGEDQYFSAGDFSIVDKFVDGGKTYSYCVKYNYNSESISTEEKEITVNGSSLNAFSKYVPTTFGISWDSDSCEFSLSQLPTWNVTSMPDGVNVAIELSYHTEGFSTDVSYRNEELEENTKKIIYPNEKSFGKELFSSNKISIDFWENWELENYTLPKYGYEYKIEINSDLSNFSVPETITIPTKEKFFEKYEGVWVTSDLSTLTLNKDRTFVLDCSNDELDCKGSYSANRGDIDNFAPTSCIPLISEDGTVYYFNLDVEVAGGNNYIHTLTKNEGWETTTLAYFFQKQEVDIDIFGKKIEFCIYDSVENRSLILTLNDGEISLTDLDNPETEISAVCTYEIDGNTIIVKAKWEGDTEEKILIKGVFTEEDSIPCVKYNSYSKRGEINTDQHTNVEDL